MPNNKQLIVFNFINLHHYQLFIRILKIKQNILVKYVNEPVFRKFFNSFYAKYSVIPYQFTFSFAEASTAYKIVSNAFKKWRLF